jgi:hypothetical protein
MQLPPSKSKHINCSYSIRVGKFSLLSQLSASINEVQSEKDRTISNETVGLNSTVSIKLPIPNYLID